MHNQPWHHYLLIIILSLFFSLPLFAQEGGSDAAPKLDDDLEYSSVYLLGQPVPIKELESAEIVTALADPAEDLEHKAISRLAVEPAVVNHILSNLDFRLSLTRACQSLVHADALLHAYLFLSELREEGGSYRYAMSSDTGGYTNYSRIRDTRRSLMSLLGYLLFTADSKEATNQLVPILLRASRSNGVLSNLPNADRLKPTAFMLKELMLRGLLQYLVRTLNLIERVEVSVTSSYDATSLHALKAELRDAIALVVEILNLVAADQQSRIPRVDIESQAAVKLATLSRMLTALAGSVTILL